MARVFSSKLAGAEAVVFSHDHCPPHVTIRHRPDGWVARIGFSFLTDDVILWDVEPQKNAPRRSDLNAVLDEVQDELEASRRQWWSIQGTVCLDNRWVQVETSELMLTLLARKQPGASQIESACYDVTTRELTLRFRGSGSSLQVKAGSGDER